MGKQCAESALLGLACPEVYQVSLSHDVYSLRDNTNYDTF